MKTFAAAILVLLSLASAVNAAPVAGQGAAADPAGRAACSRTPFERVALTAAAPCCAGVFACPQLLANTGLVKPKRADRT